MTIEVLKQCLSMLEHASTISAKDWKVQSTILIADINQAIKELESQEPIAAVASTHEYQAIITWRGTPMPHGSVLYTYPSRRTWVGLTDEEITALKHNGERYISSQDFARAIEAKLKEKNS